MPRAYSQDLRNRVIDAVMLDGLSCRAAARRFEISEPSAIKWLQHYRKTGERGPRGTGGHRRSVLKPHRAWLISVLTAEPDLTLEALSARLAGELEVRADTSMLSRFFRRERISFKKNPARGRARPA